MFGVSCFVFRLRFDSKRAETRRPNTKHETRNTKHETRNTKHQTQCRLFRVCPKFRPWRGRKVYLKCLIRGGAGENHEAYRKAYRDHVRIVGRVRWRVREPQRHHSRRTADHAADAASDGETRRVRGRHPRPTGGRVSGAKRRTNPRRPRGDAGRFRQRRAASRDVPEDRFHDQCLHRCPRSRRERLLHLGGRALPNMACPLAVQVSPVDPVDPVDPASPVDQVRRVARATPVSQASCRFREWGRPVRSRLTGPWFGIPDQYRTAGRRSSSPGQPA